MMANQIKYKGYHGTVEYCDEDGILVGSVLGIQDSLSYCGHSVEEITRAFHDCIDGYLAMCKELGRQPDKEYKGSFNVRVTPQLHRSAARAAEKQGVSLNQFVQTAIEHQLQIGDFGNSMAYFADIEKLSRFHASKNPFSDARYKSSAVAFGWN